MVQINGIPILADIAIGRIRVYQEPQSASETGRGEAFERSRLERALAQVGERLGQLYEKALRETGEEEAAILEIHQMLLEDEDFQDAVNERLAEGCSAEYAVRQAGEDIAQMFSEMDDNMKARAADIRDVASRLVRILSGTGDLELTEPAILMAEDLAPSTTIQLDRSKLLGFVTKGGSVNSHTAILSRTLNIPALVQAHIQPEWDGKLAVIDGVNGVLYVDPNQEILSAMNQVKAQIPQRRCQLQELKGKKAITKDGRSVLIYANVGSLYEVELALENDAEGIGLFRSEFLYLHHGLSHLGNRALLSANLLTWRQPTFAIDRHKRANLKRRADDRARSRNATAAQVARQIGREEPVVQVELVLLDPGSRLVE